MEERLSDWLLALAGGVILTMMIDANSLLAKFSSPIFASWMAYGVGTVLALIFIIGLMKFFPQVKNNQGQTQAKIPLWVYLGGIPGAMTVVLAAITVNSTLALSGSFALMLLGQIIFSILSDHFGFFGTRKKSFTLRDLAVVLLVLTGSVIIVYFR